MPHPSSKPNSLQSSSPVKFAAVPPGQEPLDHPMPSSEEWWAHCVSLIRSQPKGKARLSSPSPTRFVLK